MIETQYCRQCGQRRPAHMFLKLSDGKLLPVLVCRVCRKVKRVKLPPDTMVENDDRL